MAGRSVVMAKIEWLFNLRFSEFAKRLISNLVLALPLAMFLLPSAAHSYTPRTVSGWAVGPMYDTDGSCIIEISYEGKGESQLKIVFNPAQGVYVILSNSYWSVEKGADLQLSYHFSSGSYVDVKAKGIDTGEFVSLFDEAVLIDFSKSTYLHVDRGAVAVDKLSLRGSGAAVSELKRCVGSIRAESQSLQKERKKFDHLPDDPFGN